MDRRHVVALALAVALAAPTVAAAKSGNIFVGDDGGGDVVRLNPKAGHQKVIVPASNSKLDGPVGGAFKGKKLYIADYDLPGVAKINTKTGHVDVVKKNGPFSEPLDLDIGPDGRGYVAEESGSNGVIRINLKTGKTHRIAEGNNLDSAFALVFKGKRLLVADSVAGIVQVDPKTGDKRVICDDPDLQGGQGVAFIGDQIYANNGESKIYRVRSKHKAAVVAQGNPLDSVYDMEKAPHKRLYAASEGNGKVVRVDPKTGHTKVVGSGGHLDSSEGLTVQP
jgi:streptogramin lyase